MIPNFVSNMYTKWPINDTRQKLILMDRVLVIWKWLGDKSFLLKPTERYHKTFIGNQRELLPK